MSYSFSEDTTKEDLLFLPDFLENFNGAILYYKEVISEPEELEEEKEWFENEWNEDWLKTFKEVIPQCKAILEEIERNLDTL